LDQDLKNRALALYTPPFRVMEGAIYDAAGNMVADDREGVARVRGWGRIGYLQDGAALQDMVGELLVAAMNAYWEDNIPSMKLPGEFSNPEELFKAMGVDDSSIAAREEKIRILQGQLEAERVRADEGWSRLVDVTAELNAVRDAKSAGLTIPVKALPHPDCDEACHYHCTEAGACAPKCIAESAAQGKAQAEEALAAANADSPPPADFYVSEQHGRLHIAYTDQTDPAYRWQPVWLEPRYEQNAAVRRKATILDELTPMVQDTAFPDVRAAVSAALEAMRLSDELILGAFRVKGLGSVSPGTALAVVHEVLRTAGIPRVR